jgi:hypothetical protein
MTGLELRPAQPAEGAKRPAAHAAKPSRTDVRRWRLKAEMLQHFRA